MLQRVLINISGFDEFIILKMFYYLNFLTLINVHIITHHNKSMIKNS